MILDDKKEMFQADEKKEKTCKFKQEGNGKD